ncbi:MAG: hypothetical protein H7175_14330 [Burkholderiales bacterium]|nr:hypothetical protein [Anaerolineae bacterium]
MVKVLNRLFRLRPGETGIVLTLGFVLLANSMALELSDVVAVSGFLSQVDVSNILIVWAIDMVLILLTAGAQSLIVDRFDRLRFLQAMIFIFAMVYVVLRLMFVFKIPDVVNYGFLFLLVEQQWIFFPLVFWILANDIFDMTQSKRLFPFIASWGFVGQILGLGLAAAAPALLRNLGVSPAELLSFNVLIYLVAYVALTFGLRNIKLRKTQASKETARESLTEGWGFVKEVMSFRYLMMAVLAMSLVITIVDFHFLVVSDKVFQNAAPGSFQTFYGLYRLGVTIIAITIQATISGRLIERVNLKTIFLVLPYTMVASVGVMFVPTLAASAISRALLRLTKNAIDDPAQKALRALVPEERRGRVSMFMDSYLFAIGVIVGCVLTGIVVFFGLRSGNPNYYYIYLGIAAAAALFSVWAIYRMRKVYDSSLFNWRLKRRQRGGSILDRLV